ncbi:hypothetical protein RND71_020818 [Anisodus tanguticus]|uniref:Uncharacterized protein n=1 Tax=Anisodus tanguticus TaxID=243964 RepID=A0AAE1RU36_9SOLA|nr:hypothetical protein RND71_020818 [Anisodus tanguticus]
MKENQELSLKRVEYQYQDSIKNFGSLSMVDDGDKKGNFFDSTKKENQEVSHNQDEYQYQDSTKNFGSLSMVDDGDKKVGDFFVQSEKLAKGQLEEGPLKLKRHWREVGATLFLGKGLLSFNFFDESEKLGLSGSEKLKRHWTKVGGSVFVPKEWGYEGSLTEWMDYSSFDKILAPKELKSAREALMSQGKPARSGSTSTSRMLDIRGR